MLVQVLVKKTESEQGLVFRTGFGIRIRFLIPFMFGTGTESEF
jgi:hypothetical protein